MSNSIHYTLGIDIGSTTVKIAILDEAHHILFSDYKRHFANIQEPLSDLLKDSMKGGLDGLMSSTKKSTGGKQPVAAPTEKETAVHCNFVINKSIHTRMKFLAIKKNMSLKDIVNEAMKEYLEKNEQ